MRFRGRGRKEEVVPAWQSRGKRPPVAMFGTKGMSESAELRNMIRTGTVSEKLNALTDVHRKMEKGTIGAENAVSILLRALSDENSLVRRHAVGVLAADRRTIRGLLLCLENENGEVRMLASALINRTLIVDPGLWKTNIPTDEEVNDACKILMRALLDREERVRMESCGSLCQLAQRSPFNTLEALVTFIRRNLSDLTPDERLRGRLARIEFDATQEMKTRE